MAQRIRLALTISGAVALGAFEGGVLAALLNGLRPLCQGEDPLVVIDAIGGASAGSMTALVAARCLTGGFDPVGAMKQAWVSGDSIQQLLRNTGDSPLSARKLQSLAQVLFGGETAGELAYQTRSVRLVMVMACLRGLEYEVKGNSQAAIDATTYVDLATFDIDHGWGAAQYLEPEFASPAAIAIASGANEVGFPPQLLNRSNSRAAYEARGLSFPDGGYMWYTDGGTIDNEPLGHTLDLTNDLDRGCPADTRRVHILIHPDPGGGPTGTLWSNRDKQPTWLATLKRGLHMQRTQSLYDDLREVVKTSTRIGWLDQVIDALNATVETLPTDEKQKLAVSLRTVLQGIGTERELLPGSTTAAPDLDISVTELIDSAIRTAAGVSGKQVVGVEVISPVQLAKSQEPPRAVSQVLAGDVLGHFGGFFDEGMRRSDFDLGYQSALLWMEGGLGRCGLEPDQVAQAKDAATEAYKPAPMWKKWGETTVGNIARRHPVALAGLLAQVVRVSMRDVLFMRRWRKASRT